MSTKALQLHLPADLFRFVEERVRSGRGDSAEEVIHDALELLRDQDLTSSHRDLLRAQIAEGLEQARNGDLVDGEGYFDTLEARLG